MKPLSIAIFLLSVGFLFSCQESTLDAACSNAGNFVKRVVNVNGRVFYDSTEAKYMILAPNSMDSHDVGYR